MAIFYKDLTGQDTAIVRDMFVDDDTYVQGEFMYTGQTGGTDLGSLISIDLANSGTVATAIRPRSSLTRLGCG
jgi:hypothetical protein